MTWTATITSQRQITIPAELFHQKVFRPGEKVVVESADDGVKITSALALVRKLAGSVKLPKRFRGMSINQIRKRAIEEYFAHEYSR